MEICHFIHLGKVSVLRTMLLCLLPSAPTPPLWRRCLCDRHTDLVAGVTQVAVRAIILRKKTIIIAEVTYEIAFILSFYLLWVSAVKFLFCKIGPGQHERLILLPRGQR